MKGYENAISCLAPPLSIILSNIDEKEKAKINEIRIRLEKPITLIHETGVWFVNCNSKLMNYPGESAYIVSKKELNDCFSKICDYSIHSKNENLIKGYVTVKGGIRVGVASSAVVQNGSITSVKDITSLNIRVAKGIIGAGQPILNTLFVNSSPSIIVASKPSGGKTTVLRDMARLLSSGFNSRYRRVSIIDERNEIAGKYNGGFVFDVGLNTDVLTGFSKASGIEIALRTLAPEYIICDEIATVEEANAINYAFASGVNFIVSMHIKNKESLFNKKVFRALLESNEFSYIVFLNNYSRDIEIVDCREVSNEIFRIDSSCNGNNSFGNNFYI